MKVSRDAVWYTVCGETMRRINDTYKTEIIINKSRFIATLCPVQNNEDMKATLEALRQAYPGANHHCHASMIGPGGEQQIASDDGEPSRTAGVPILDVIRHHDVTDVLLVVTRYFGGIKLGAGGLVRAYTKAAATVLHDARFVRPVTLEVHKIVFAYDMIDTIEHLMKDKATILDREFGEHVTFDISIDPVDLHLIDAIRHRLIDARMTGTKEIFIPD
jgi:uncharacterized YigZ family protein